MHLRLAPPALLLLVAPFASAKPAAAPRALLASGTPQIRITEYMYNGAAGEFVELTNLGAVAVNLAGWSLTDELALPFDIDLTPLGLIQPGQSVVITEFLTSTFAAEWNLSGVSLMQNLGLTRFGRNDAIVLFNNLGGLHDFLIYGDEVFPGTIRALNRSGLGCTQALGTNDISEWVLASLGDGHGSVQSVGGDLGSPGSYTPVSCLPSYDAQLSEVRIAQPGADTDEYFELAGSGSLAGLSYVVLSNTGTVQHITDLSSLSISASGFLLAAEASFSLGAPDLVTVLDFEDTTSVTHMLLADFSGVLGDDLDNNNDGILDITPWSVLVDSLGFQGPFGFGPVYSPNIVAADGMGVASLAILCATGWRVGPADINGLEDTPGQPNHCPPPTFDALLSEIRTDSPGTDLEEYFELSGSGSLEGVWYVVLGDFGFTDPSGVVEMALDLSGRGFGPSGLFVAAEGTFTLGTANLIANMHFENDDNVTHMLVREFTGSLGQDLDVNNDGVLEFTPWSSVLDAVGFVDDLDFLIAGHIYANVSVGPGLLGAPAHLIKCPASGNWLAGHKDALVVDTPGAANPCSGLGVRYCQANPNSTGGPARMSAAGSTSVSTNSFTLECFDMPTVLPNSIFNYFVIGSGTGFVPNVIGQGNLCLGGSLARYRGPGQVTNAGLTGSAMVTIDLAVLPSPLMGGISAGETWFFQNFYRDSNPNITSNLSDALAVTFTP